MMMENSSEFGCQISGSSTGLNFNRNPRSILTGTVRFSGDSDHDSGIRLDHVRTQFGRFGEGGGEVIRPVERKDVSLRQWLDDGKRAVDDVECLHIFMQILEIVNSAHSKKIVVHNLRPSRFTISPLNLVLFLESASCSDPDSDSSRNVLNIQKSGFEAQNHGNVSETVSDLVNLEETKERKRSFPVKQILEMETDWYRSPEEAAGDPSSCASDVYRLGALLFELYCTCSSPDEKNASMASLRHRVFPPQFLLKWPKEALFCLWLLHPEPASRPKIDEVLQSEFLTELRDNLDQRVAAIELQQRIHDHELLQEFLLIMQRRKLEAANNLHSIVSVLTSDLEEVVKLQSSITKKSGSTSDLRDPPLDFPSNNDSASSGSRKRIRSVIQTHNSEESNVQQDGFQKSENLENAISKTPRLMSNFRKLESAYFLTRRRAFKPERSSANGFSSRERLAGRQTRWIDSFLDGLRKYLSFNKLKVKADLKQADLLSSSNHVCSLSFDRDGEFFATGMNKKIKVFEYDSILNGNRDVQYPIVEMASRSKLSSVCWNRYIKGQIASSNFEGVVQIWDVTRNQAITEMREHERRTWSVDFSSADPTLLASGSDDGSVKLWNINQGVSVCTIKTNANVCCVQFPSDTGNSLAFGSADHRIYFYDLRNPSGPLYTLVGHERTVSYVRFLDSTTLVSSSTDNTLKLWDLSECSSEVLDSPLQSFTGHTNLKNFVGLSVSEGYIATGSETNEVFIYHKAFPMPTLAYKFNTIDPISGDEVDDTEQFVSSVCWRNQTSSLVAANSMGDVKLLEMV
ncbi:protein SPA1-RELATED 4-like [Cynara cardunculus var. scolymus]|uniref:protein SPA1-RELATED 4-like n=1 Tax=Cynara cardunculus var. scolymus TaxID=59895 RepID=UPI000D62A53F|nr:protein SPA1-RELATED 4-like [Cynara cardunculus var. scolymus]